MKTKTVTQYAKGRAIASYASMSLAARLSGTDLSNLSKTVRGRRNTAGGYNWKQGQNVAKRGAIVTAYAPTGEAMATFANLDIVRNETTVRFEQVAAVISGTRKSANGLIWK